MTGIIKLLTAYFIYHKHLGIFFQISVTDTGFPVCVCVCERERERERERESKKESKYMNVCVLVSVYV